MVLPYITDRIVEVADSSPRLVVMNKSAMRYGLPESYSFRSCEARYVVAVNRMTWFGGVYDEPRRIVQSVAIDVDTMDETWPDDAFDPGDGRAAQGASRRRGGRCRHHASLRMEVGQNVMLRSQIYPVTLLFKSSAPIPAAAIPSVFMFRRDYLDEAIHDQARVDMMWVRCAEFRGSPAAIAGQIDSTFRNSGAETETDTEKAFLTTYLVRFQSLGYIVQAVGFCAVFAIALAVLNGSAMTLRERRGEIAVCER